MIIRLTLNPAHILAALAVTLSLMSASSSASSGPRPPCGTSAAVPHIDYGPLNGPPKVEVWQNATLSLGATCPSILNGSAELVIVLASRFVHAGTVQDLATRVGAVSVLKGLKYWSVTDQRWRVLISEAFAVDDTKTLQRRPDFTASEILSGKTLLMAQRDTRSAGLNYYALQTTSHNIDHLTVSIVNLTDIRFLFATLFKQRSLISAHFLTHLGGDEWGYYSLTVVKDAPMKGQEKSFINREAAYLRFVTGQRPEKEPPVAR